jgi:hypothetical protein
MAGCSLTNFLELGLWDMILGDRLHAADGKTVNRMKDHIIFLLLDFDTDSKDMELTNPILFHT